MRLEADNVRIYAQICIVTSVRLGVVVAANQSQGPNGGHDCKHSRRQQIAANEMVRGEEDFDEPGGSPRVAS